MSSTQTQTVVPVQPDISYHPDFAKYQLRSERVKAELTNKDEFPAGFPRQLTGPLVWEGRDFTDESEWTLVLNAAQLLEIEEALAHFNCMYFTILQRNNSDNIL